MLLDIIDYIYLYYPITISCEVALGQSAFQSIAKRTITLGEERANSSACGSAWLGRGWNRRS